MCRRGLRLSKKPVIASQSADRRGNLLFTQGELEGAKPASNQIKCRAKPCLARRAWSEATISVPQGGTKITTLFQAVASRPFAVCKREIALLLAVLAAWLVEAIALGREIAFVLGGECRRENLIPVLSNLDFARRICYATVSTHRKGEL